MKEKEFVKWMYENHFKLYDVNEQDHWFVSDSFGTQLIPLNELYEIYLLSTK